MSITSIFANAASALSANQEALRLTSTNISNVNTPGYVRQEAQFQPRVLAGGAGGVDITVLRRTADQFLQNAVYRASASASAGGISAEFLNRAQAFFGDPAQASSLFNRLDSLFTAASDLTLDPSSAPRRSTLVNNLDETLGAVRTLSGNLDSLAREADSRIVSGVKNANDLLTQVALLNREITRYTVTGQDAAGAQTQQRAAIDSLGKLLDIRVTPRAQGGVDIRTQDGVLLVGDTAGQLSYAGGTSNANQEFGQILFQAPNLDSANLRPIQDSLQGGELRGLINARDQDLPSLRSGLAALAAGLADALNTAHNSASATPPPATLAGRNTGLVGTDSLNFSGSTTFAVVDQNGNLVAQANIDLSTIATVNGAVAAINAGLGGAASASFANGKLTINAAGAGNGVAIADVTSPTSNRAGRSFSDFFGLNDLVSSPTPLFFDTGLQGSDALNITSGQLSLQVRSAAGSVLTTTTINPAGLTVQGLVNALNADPTLSSTFTFSLDSKGALVSTPINPSAQARLAVAADNTVRGDTGLSVSSLFGLSRAARDSRAGGLSLRSDILANNNLLATGTPQLAGAAIGARVLAKGDSTGASRIAAAFESSQLFAPEGLSASTSTVSDFAARLAGDAGERAAAAQRTADGATALSDEAGQRRQSVEGVNLDEELVRLTQFQQSYSAAARVIQAADELLRSLLQIGA